MPERVHHQVVATSFAVDADVLTDPKKAGRVGGAKMVEQRYRAVIDVLDGMSVSDVARRNGVTR